jgi:hypothetical protein
MSGGGLEILKMQNHMQVSVEDGALAPWNVNEEQVQATIEVHEPL